jgi:hypothetical protein
MNGPSKINLAHFYEEEFEELIIIIIISFLIVHYIHKISGSG